MRHTQEYPVGHSVADVAGYYSSSRGGRVVARQAFRRSSMQRTFHRVQSVDMRWNGDTVNEADTCRQFVVPKLQEAGWDERPYSFTEQRTFTDGRIIPVGSRVRRGKQKRADYLLRYRRDFPIAVVEAKPEYKLAGAGLQQAKEYAQILDLKFAYSTNGHGIVEFDFLAGTETLLDHFPTPQELWMRLQPASVDAKDDWPVLAPYNLQSAVLPRYYQDVAINRTVQAIVDGRQRLLLTMATGTGKTTTAFQICWKLWVTRWNRTGDHRRPRILYLADRNILVDDPLTKDFAPFGDAACKLSGINVTKSRDIYFAIYQAIAEDEVRPGLYKTYAPDFFDLIIIDECHRGSARANSTWREILEYFRQSAQLGMTATPLRDESRDSYSYFGDPVYTYSLRQGIEDGFLAPYRLHRVVTTADAVGWRPSKGELDIHGREIPDEEYQTRDFERVIALRARTEAIANHLTEHLKKTDRFAKTLVFCVDQDHADQMRRALTNLNRDLIQQYPHYVARVTADEGAIGKGYLSEFQDLETVVPVILTTSQLLTTGVNAPMVKNVALARVVGSMSEFKQIIGRGTRVRSDYGKFMFTILDYTGSASQHFADPDFDGNPTLIVNEEIDDEGEIVDSTTVEPVEVRKSDDPPDLPINAITDDELSAPAKFVVDGGVVKIAHEVVSELDPRGKQLRVVQYTDYTAEQVRHLFPTAHALQVHWQELEARASLIEELESRGIDFGELARQTSQPEADPLDLLCHLAFNAPLRTRRERADRLVKDHPDYFENYGATARKVLEVLLEKYAAHGIAEFKLPDILKVPPISDLGSTTEIIQAFGGVANLRDAVQEMQVQLYSAA